MRTRRLLGLVLINLRSSPVSAASALVGVAIGTALLTFFVGLGEGLRDRVLNRILPANQVELEPRPLRVFGVSGSIGGDGLSPGQLQRLRSMPGVVRALGRQRSAFPARLWGGKHLIGYDLYTEAFFDGVPDGLLRPELAAFERGLDLGSARADRCDVDDDCPAGSRCDEGLCAKVSWAERFRSTDVDLHCDQDADCAPGRVCAYRRCAPPCGEGGTCAPGHSCDRTAVAAAKLAVGGGSDHADRAEASRAPTAGACVATCASDADCRDGAHCPQAVGRPRRCTPLPCLLAEADDARSLDPRRARGTIAAACAEGSGGLCAGSGSCPGQSYCAAIAPGARVGACELPVPAVLNPLLLEVFNTDMAASLGIPRVAAPEAVVGLRFHLALGDSYFAADASRERQHIRQAVIVGFSTKAPELGLILPLDAVAGWNARFGKVEQAARYDGAIVEVASNERLAGVIAEAEGMGLQLSRRARTARTFGTVVLLVYLALVLIALVVLATAALSIAHTFAILIHERRRDFAILRALGATRRAIAAIVWIEAATLGLCGGALGLAMAHLGAAAVQAAAAKALVDVPLLPAEFFVFPGWSYGAPLALGALCCVAGAWWPARRAAALDPAAVLSQP